MREGQTSQDEIKRNQTRQKEMTEDESKRNKTRFDRTNVKTKHKKM